MPAKWLPILVAMTGISGCLDDTGQAQFPTLHAWETAEYELREMLEDGGHVKVGQVLIDLELGAMLQATIQIRSFPQRGHLPQEHSAVVQIEPGQGRTIRVQRENDQDYPWGTAQHVPTPTTWGIVLDEPSQWLPLGPQWALLADGFPQAQLLSKAASPDGWSVQARAPCQFQCAYGSAPDVAVARNWTAVTWTLSSSGAGLLPESAEVRAEGSREWVAVLVRTKHDVGPSVPLPVSAPPDTPVLGTCNWFPCEPAGWPLNRSFERGFDAVRQGPDWRAWDDGTARPLLALIADTYQTTLVLDQPVLTDRALNWRYHFVKGDDFRTFYVESEWDPLTSTFGAPAVVGVDQQAPFDPSTPWSLLPPNVGPGMPADVLWSKTMELAPPSFQPIVTQLRFHSQPMVPDPTLAGVYQLVGADGSCSVYFATAAPKGCALSG